MTTYQNGLIPAPGQPGSPLTVIDHGTDSNGYWEFQISAHTLWMWNAAKAYALKHFGKTLHIRTGWNCYRPFAIQKAARARACAAGNCNAAAYEGYSSHGGTWIDSQFTGGRWVDTMAIDVDPNGLTWAQVWEACRAAGFLCNAITVARAGIEEPWHIIDLHPWDAIPSDVNVQPFEEDDMPYTQQDIEGFVRNALFQTFTNGVGPADFGGKWPFFDIVASQIWGHPVQAQDANGNLLYQADGKTPVLFPASGFLASTNGKVGAAPAQVDVAALAAQLAPLLIGNLQHLPDADVQAIAKAAADEEDRRERERLGS